MHATNKILRDTGRGLADALGNILDTLCTALLVGAGVTWGALMVLEIYWRVIP
jgi:hypothetical protein